VPDDPDFDVIRRAWAATGDRDEATVREALHPDIVAIPLTVEGERYEGIENVLAWWRDNLQNWEGFEVVPEQFTRRGEDIIASGGWYVRDDAGETRLIRPATWLLRMRDGRIVYWRTYSDRDEALSENGP
jgi:ketosteroid isomerase-like protein